MTFCSFFDTRHHVKPVNPLWNNPGLFFQNVNDGLIEAELCKLLPAVNVMQKLRKGKLHIVIDRSILGYA